MENSSLAPGRVGPEHRPLWTVHCLSLLHPGNQRLFLALRFLSESCLVALFTPRCAALRWARLSESLWKCPVGDRCSGSFRWTGCGHVAWRPDWGHWSGACGITVRGGDWGWRRLHWVLGVVLDSRGWVNGHGVGSEEEGVSGEKAWGSSRGESGACWLGDVGENPWKHSASSWRQWV